MTAGYPNSTHCQLCGLLPVCSHAHFQPQLKFLYGHLPQRLSDPSSRIYIHAQYRMCEITSLRSQNQHSNRQRGRRTEAGIIAQSSIPKVPDFHRSMKRAIVVVAAMMSRTMINIVVSHFLWESLMYVGGGCSAEGIVGQKSWKTRLCRVAEVFYLCSRLGRAMLKA
jgi:hypothetical protein